MRLIFKSKKKHFVGKKAKATFCKFNPLKALLINK